MKFLELLLNPSIFALAALLASVVWMLKDEKDKTRPIVVFALVLNLLYPWLFTLVMGGEAGLLPWKYDHMLLRIDDSLGVSAAALALPLQGALRIPLLVVYKVVLPIMVLWLLLMRSPDRRGAFVIAYVAEMLAGPVVYAIVPACGPIYAFGAQWLHPPAVQANAIRLIGIMNAFPSLHIATAFVLVLFAPGKLWRGVALAFLGATALATLSTGEHYVVDLIPGLAFGCFAVSVGFRRVRSALAYLGVVLAWSFTVRFGYLFLIAHSGLLRTFATLTVALAVFAVIKEWRVPAISAAQPAIASQE
jgi:hypothetical protein